MPSPNGLVPLGAVQPGANTTVYLMDVFPDLRDTPVQSVHAIMFQAHDGNVDKTYIGDSTLNVMSDTGIIYVMAAPTNTFIPGIAIDAAVSQAGVPLHQIYLAAVNANDKIRVSVLVV